MQANKNMLLTVETVELYSNRPTEWSWHFTYKKHFVKMIVFTQSGLKKHL